MQDGLKDTRVKPSGTVAFVAGMIDAFPSKQVQSYLLVGIKEDSITYNYMGMVAKSKDKSLIVPILNAAITPTVYSKEALTQAYDEAVIPHDYVAPDYVAEMTVGESYSVYGKQLFLEDIQIVPTPDADCYYCRLLFNPVKVLEHGE